MGELIPTHLRHSLDCVLHFDESACEMLKCRLPKVSIAGEKHYVAFLLLVPTSFSYEMSKLTSHKSDKPESDSGEWNC